MLSHPVQLWCCLHYSVKLCDHRYNSSMLPWITHVSQSIVMLVIYARYNVEFLCKFKNVFYIFQHMFPPAGQPCRWLSGLLNPDICVAALCLMGSPVSWSVLPTAPWLLSSNSSEDSVSADGYHCNSGSLTSGDSLLTSALIMMLEWQAGQILYVCINLVSCVNSHFMF